MIKILNHCFINKENLSHRVPDVQEAACAYARKPKLGGCATPFVTKPSSTDQEGKDFRAYRQQTSAKPASRRR